MSFNSSEVFVRGHAINNVEGNQVNHSQAITAEVVHINSQREIERTEYDEFEQVKRGNIFTLERVHTGDPSEWWEWEWEEKDGEWVRTKPKRSAQRTICTVQVRPDQQTKYTVAFYEGEDADFFWKRDFEHFSCAGLGKPDVWQLYGLNRSKIPFLVFHDELVPLGNFYKNSFWGDLYVSMLKMHLGCQGSNQIWLNMQGNLCKGLKGPDIEIRSPSVSKIIVPPSAQMLQDDICFNFFQQSVSSQFEEDVLHYAYILQTHTCLDSLLPEPTNYPSSDHIHSPWTFEACLDKLFRNLLHHLPPDILEGLHFDTVYSTSREAVARCPRGKGRWEAWYYQGLVNETDMGDGLIRFKLDDPEDVKVFFRCVRNYFQGSWLVQSARIIDAHGMSGMEEKCFIIGPPDFALYTTWFGHHRYPITLEDLPPIYLFIYPPPSSISESMSWEKGHTQTHFWSLDENGQSEMSEEECRRWGVLELYPLIYWHDSELRSWPTDVYTALRKWQVARGFDPSTADWAQSLGYPELEIIGGKEEEARFEGVHDGVSYLIKLREQEAQAREAEAIAKLDDILESSAFLRDPFIHSAENTPQASPSDEQDILPPLEQNEPSSTQEAPKEETKSNSWWWSWEAVTGSGISVCM